MVKSPLPSTKNLPTHSNTYMHPAFTPYTQLARSYTAKLYVTAAYALILLTETKTWTNLLTHQLNYDQHTITQQINRAKKHKGNDLLTYKKKQSSSRIPLVVTYHTAIKPLQRIIDNLQPLLQDNDLKHIFHDKPFLAYRQPANLKRHLISSKFSQSTLINGTFPCHSTKCELCHLNHSESHILGPNGYIINIKGHFTCSSTNIIYAITCNICPNAVYIGQTGQTLRNRINGHKFDIRHKLIKKPVAEHFTSTGHTINNLRVAVVKKGNFKNNLDREICEQKIIKQLDCVNLGLNKDYGFLAHYRE
ncbi:uncharacterized protein LOC117120378 [Anneissia japonica]|uniref:uncharacterized protein LOC117120378 n=1 Tax=Anneissia japonica TaxID=1529436 RepID=UPI001425B378|nr:uncharacterized protein LOC117120378 [Anneissia japonica]